MVLLGKPLTYEEERLCTIEENKRRMKELGLLDMVESFRKQPTQKKPSIRMVTTNVKLAVETRRSSRAATRLKVDYKEVRRPRADNKEASIDVGVRRTRGVGRPLLRRGCISAAAVRAGDIKTSYPSFVKAMLKSHTSGGFWLGLPSDFCNINFTKDVIIVLEDEEGLEWECVYLHHKHGLSGGWRGFSLDHDLEDGDAAVFELVTSSRFKVYITRATSSEETLARKTVAVANKSEYRCGAKNSRNVQFLEHEPPKREKRDQFDRRKKHLCKQSKVNKRAKRNVNCRNNWSSDEGPQSEDNSQAADCNTEVWDKEESVQSSDDDRHPTRKLEGKITRSSKRLVRSKQQCQAENIGDGDEEESDGDVHPTAKLKEKVTQVVRRPGKSEQPPKVTPSEKEKSKTSTKVVKKGTFVRRADRKTDVQEVRKETTSRQTERKCNLPPGTRLKPVGVCSIARGSSKRKLPAIFPGRKFDFLSGPKSVKVH